VRLAASTKDGFRHRIALLHHVNVPKTKHAIPPRFQEAAALFIRGGDFIHTMLAAIQFDNELCRWAKEIGDIGTDRLLTAEP
jgi:hypothetical protein